MGSRLIESAAYYNQTLLAQLNISSAKNSSVNWIIRLLLSLLCWPKVILSSGHCIVPKLFRSFFLWVGGQNGNPWLILLLIDFCHQIILRWKQTKKSELQNKNDLMLLLSNWYYGCVEKVRQLVTKRKRTIIQSYRGIWRSFIRLLWLPFM